MLKISDIEQLNNEIFALLSTRFSCLKIAQLIKQIGINRRRVPSNKQIVTPQTKPLSKYGHANLVDAKQNESALLK